MAFYDIIDFENQFSFKCSDDETILSAAEAIGIDLPYSSRIGADSSTAARLISGKVEQSGAIYLDEAQIAAGFILIDVAYPRSDCLIRFFAQEELENWVPGTV
ncbi:MULTISPECIES: 2Fe-2S iron-sulfur cluster-binding protein [Pectobacterium]|uniref:2Fe-2S iron-sulfur cluster-binding protein n=1 Tax=Pectobacterium TaxID=122277 RepID=UPI000CDE7161|nr:MULTISPECIES: 2Fe-2S iron-sulfur cluster-binding protein [Pectobacterium]MBQ4794830.1 ferredoxin [Pectobacterium versatile]POY55658.1 ferredoxin [Pectobacterium versatile]PRI20337.1 ferredoxin [Pectobacterium versatile]PWD65667.1 ferredoxin [Pectobacterium versatile]QHP58786.1 ferredoxin [Pectobacterium carotovorum subsp. carotovorum]